MAMLYRVIYINKGKEHVAVSVSATSISNAVASAKSNDSAYKDHVSATISGSGSSIIAGS